MSKILVVGDVHDDVGCSKDRFHVLGKFIIKEKPDYIVLMGDFLTLDSVSRHNKGKPLLAEGKRLMIEIESGKESLDIIDSYIDSYNKKKRKLKKRIYDPIKVYIYGNHEDRLVSYIHENPQIEGIIDSDDILDCRKKGWKIVGYRDTYYIQDVGFTHIPMNGANQPISGKYVCRRALELYNTHIVFGHTHRIGVDIMSTKTEYGYKQKIAINVGNYFDYIPEYAKNSAGIGDWWTGVVMLYKDEGLDFQFISYNKMRNFV